MSTDIKTIGIYPLAGPVTVSLAAAAATPLYTVPTNFKAVLNHVVLIAGDDCSTATVTVGRSTALTDFLGTQTLSGINADEDVAIMFPQQATAGTPLINKTYAAGVVISMNVVSAVGGATNQVYLWGYLIAV